MITRIHLCNITLPIAIQIDGNYINIPYRTPNYIAELEKIYGVSFCWEPKNGKLIWNKKKNKLENNIDYYLRQLLHFSHIHGLQIHGMLSWTVLKEGAYDSSTGVAYIKADKVTIVHFNPQLPTSKYPNDVDDIAGLVSYMQVYGIDSLIKFT